MKIFVSFISSILLVLQLTGNASAVNQKQLEEFKDFDNDQYWSEPMQWAISEDIVRGFSNGTIRPNDTITEGQFLKVLFRFYFPDGYFDIPSYVDFVNSSQPAYYEYNAAKYYDLPVSDITNFSNPIRRGSVAHIIATAQLGKNIGETEAVTWMYDSNLARGYNSSDKTYHSFQPNTTLTRAHAVTFMYNYYKNSNLNKSLQKKESEAINRLNQLYDDKTAFLNIIHSYEEQFANDSYLGVRSMLSPVGVIKGNNNVILSAPHSTKQLRDGSIKDADIYTGALALLLQDLTNSSVIYTTQLAEDANYIENGVYKDTLRKLVNETKGKYVIDLHGAAATRPFEIDLGTLNGQSISSQYASNITRIFQSNQINQVTQNHTFKGASKGTITNYSYNQLHIGAVQVEINRSLRNPREDIDAYYRLVKSLIEVIEMMG